MSAPSRTHGASLMAAALFLSSCFGSKKGFENWNATVPAGRFKTVATIAGGDGRNDLRMTVQVRNDLNKAGLTAVRSAGRWESVAQMIQQVCAPTAGQPVDGVVIVKYDYLVLYDCQTSKAAFEIQGSSQTGLKDMTSRLIKYLKRAPPPPAQ